MSEETSVNVTNLVDVNEFTKEKAANSEKSSDSGVETTEACSETFPASSDSETSPVKSISNYEIEFNPNPDNDVSPTIKSAETYSLRSSTTSIPITTSAEENRTSESTSAEGSPVKNDNTKELEQVATSNGAKNDEIADIKEINVPQYEQINLKHYLATSTAGVDHNPSQYTSLTTSCVNLDAHNHCQNDSKLTSSSISLNEHISSQKLTKPFSRSAEDISHIENTNHSVFSIANKDIDEEEILTQFAIQKKQANATQRIPESITQPVDARQTRIPKEILSQDIGSIVKNVHGMFSSVSGSLKYYTYRNVQKPAKTVKPIPNGKVMKDIFEDDTNEVVQNQKASPEELQISNEPNDQLKDEDLDPKSEVLRLQIESLERLLLEQRKENSCLTERVQQQIEELQERDQNYKDLEGQLDSMSKRVEQAEREKDAAVMRYASVECAAIEARRAAESARRAERAARAELDLLSGKLKSAHGEKQRIIQLYDDK
ncbi:putative oocyte-testis protein 1, partial [Operophtera brumata]